MKKKIKIVFSAFLISLFLTLLVIIKINTIFQEEKKFVTVFQVGVYKNEINALSEAKKYQGIVHKEDGYYRVYVAAYQNDEIISKMKNYYDKNDISIYLRKVKTTDKYLTTINKYEKMLQNSSDESIYPNLNNLLINKLKENL